MEFCITYEQAGTSARSVHGRAHMTETINGELSITVPESFRAMTADELERGYGADFANMRGFWDQERHIIITITWHKSNKILMKLADVKTLVNRAEKHLARAYAGHDYRNDGFFETAIAGQQAQGVRYGYTVEGAAHDAEAIVFLHGTCSYTVYYYTRSANAANNATIRDEVLASMAIA